MFTNRTKNSVGTGGRPRALDRPQPARSPTPRGGGAVSASEPSLPGATPRGWASTDRRRPALSGPPLFQPADPLVVGDRPAIGQPADQHAVRAGAADTR